jgi:hypothetical protein
MIALALAAALLAQEIAEQEPNNTAEAARQDLAPGASVSGSLGEGDPDWFHIALDRETVCSLALEIPEGESGRFELHRGREVFSTSSGDGTRRMLRLLLPKGRSAVHVIGQAKKYRFTVKAEERGEREEVEPNGEGEKAHEIREGETWKGRNSGFAVEMDCYVFKAATAGPRELVLKFASPSEPLRGYLGVFGADPTKVEYYYINAFADEFHFYPVFPPGPWNIQLTISADSAPGAAYEISVRPLGGRVTEDERKAALAAIDRGIRYLEKMPEEPLQQVASATESMVLAALSEGEGAKKRREALDRDIVARLESQFMKVEGGPVFCVNNNIYTHAIATLGLAEAAANGSEKAKALAIRGAEFLVATQNTERKPAAWKGPVQKREPGYGGWRYTPDSNQGDLSIAGWCLIAMTAVDAAGIKVDGLRDAVEAGLHYTRSVGDERGFGYEQPQGSGSDIHNSIGALIMLLYGEEGSALGFAKNQLDRRLWSATQVDHGDNYPFYYLYYATRAQYLRSGEVWETWRATALRQLLRRQQEDGSWAAIAYDSQTGPRWTTALGVMMLRLCLNQAPKYLRVEAKGF